jgi:eukaryotic-like serine/threonine-protein kinase
MRFTIPVPRGVVVQTMPRISPDGRILAFAGQDSLNRTMIWVRPLNSLTANPLPGSENTRTPFWSADSRYLGFVADGKLKKIAVSGGPAETICDAPTGSDGTWSRDGVILFDGAGDDPIRRVNASGGVSTVAVPSDSTLQVGWPSFLPDGKHFFYTTLPASGATQVMLGTLGASKGKTLGISGSRVEYSPDGYLIFARQRTLLGQRFDRGGLKTVGDPFPIAENLPVAGNALANFTVSSNGMLVYRATGVTLNRLVWLDRTGRELQEVAPPADYRAPALSPDGTRIAIRRRENEGSNIDVWVIDPGRGTTTRFTFDPADDSNPLWSPDGSQIVWVSTRGGSEALWSRSASGLGQDEKVVETGANSAATDWSGDGSTLLFQCANPKTGVDVYAVAMKGDRKPRVIIQTPFNENRAHLSPDGRWIAYQSDESGRVEVYVASFKGSSGKWQISTDGGIEPCWSHDGRELFYLSSDQRLMSVTIAPGEAFNATTPTPLFRILTEQGLRRNVYCPSPDGKRFLFLVPVGESSTPMTVMVNWEPDATRH